MKSLTLTRDHILTIVWVWGIACYGLLSYANSPAWLLTSSGFLFLSFVPGWLTMLSLRLRRLPFFGALALSVGFSLLELMVLGLLSNALLPLFGVARPLDQGALMVELLFLLALLSAVAFIRLEGLEFDIREKLQEVFPSILDSAVSFLPILFVLQSLVGAFNLNNGGTGIITLFLLGELALYSVVLYVYAKKFGENTIPTALYFMGLSLLFMSSMRGWYITGHDIQTEFKVFELTKNAGLWNMAFYPDPYNACLSITILPTLFFNLLHIADAYIYKFLFQWFFAFCPGIVYLISRNWVGKRLAFLAGFYFIAFPTFFVDMSFLVRQEIAFLFYGLMLWIIFEQSTQRYMRRLLFVLLGIGVILSHYSTTYTTLFIFALVILSRPIFFMVLSWAHERLGLFSNSALQPLQQKKVAKRKAHITVGMVVFLFTLSFVWTSLVTNTGGNLQKVLTETFVAIRNGFTDSTNRSTDVMNLLSFKEPNQQEKLDSYIKDVIEPIRQKSPASIYYDQSTYSQYQLVALPDEKLPLTPLGAMADNSGVDFVAIVAYIGRILAKLMEVVVPLGVVYLLYRSSSVEEPVDDSFFLISLFSLLFIFANIVVPVLSNEYGIYRALQQSMYVIALPMVLGSLWMGQWLAYVGRVLSSYLWPKDPTTQSELVPQNENYFPIVLAIVFFLYSTGFIPQLFGGNNALLFLSNSGRYHDNLLIQDPDVSAVSWLHSVTDNINGLRVSLNQAPIAGEEYVMKNLVVPYDEILPQVIRRDAFVYLDSAVVKKDRGTFVYDGSQISYTYPIQFLEDNKNLVYNNGSIEVYR